MVRLRPLGRGRLYMFGEALAQHEADIDRDPSDRNVRDVSQEPRAQGERRNTLQEYSAVEIALPEQEAHDPIQAVENTE